MRNRCSYDIVFKQSLKGNENNRRTSTKKLFSLSLSRGKFNMQRAMLNE